MRLDLRSRMNPYRLYLAIDAVMSFLFGIAYATVMVYWVISGRLNPLELLLLGTGLELSYFLCQLPTGVLADVVSRRLCIISGTVILGAALIMQGLSPNFVNLLCGQLLAGLGFALLTGAEEAWIADELGDDDGITRVYLRATQLSLAGTVVGSLLSGVIALTGLNVPLLIGGIGMCLLGGVLVLVMPENNFDPAAAGSVALTGVARKAWHQLSEQTRLSRVAIVAVPGLMLLFGMTFFAGLWSESFDRLWGAFLLRDIKFPQLAGVHPVIWFSLLAATVALLGIGSTEVASRRSDRLGPDSLAGALLVLTVLIGVSVVVMATSHAFALAVAAYLVVQVLRPVFDPLISGWMVTRIDPSVRATALSARDMFDSGGQIVSGPVIGAIGTLASIRVALLAGAAALAPAAACLAAASRKIRVRPDGASLDADFSSAGGSAESCNPADPGSPASSGKDGLEPHNG